MNGYAFFDIGNVQIFFSHEKMCKQIAHLFSMSYTDVYRAFFEKGLLEKWEVGNINSKKLYQEFSKKSKEKKEFKDFLFAISDIFWLNPNIPPIIEKLKNNKIHLVLISNIGDAHFDYLFSKFPVIQQFTNNNLLSFKMHMRKPDPKIYKKALEISQEKPAIYIDDIKEYAEMANKQGLDAILFKDDISLEKVLKQKKFL